MDDMDQGEHEMTHNLTLLCEDNSETVSPSSSNNSPAAISSKFTFPASSFRNKQGKDVQSAKLREKLAKSKMVWRNESMEKKAKGPMVARHGMNQQTNTGIGRNKSLRPTSPTYESAFKRHVVNRPVSPGVPLTVNTQNVSGLPKRRSVGGVSPSGSFNRGRKTPSGASGDVNQLDILKRKVEKASRAKLYLLQQAGPNSFIIGGETADHRHRVVIGPQTCTCGKTPHCVHILFVMVRVFQLCESDNILLCKPLKNFEVEHLFRKHEQRRKQRLAGRSDKPMLGGGNPPVSTSHTVSPDNAVIESNEHSDRTEDVNCPICLLDLKSDEELVSCEHCQNKLHHGCMAIWYQLSRRQGDDVLSCPLCRQAWTSTDAERFSRYVQEKEQQHTTSQGSSPVEGTSVAPPVDELDHTGVLPSSQPIPEEHRTRVSPWIDIFGEEMIGCLFSRSSWTVREAALRHLSREVIMQLSQSGSHSSNVLQCSCEVVAMMIADPVYKVYVASLRALRTMLSYCSRPDIVLLRKCLKEVVQSIVLKCADGNRKTSQLALSTLCEFSKGQDGELAIGKEVDLEGQESLGGSLYILECCIQSFSIHSVQWQWLNGRLHTMDRLLSEFPDDFTFTLDDQSKIIAVVKRTLVPMVEFAVQVMVKLRHSGHQTRTLRLCKRVITQSARFALIVPGMLQRFREMLTPVEKDQRTRLERRLLELARTLGIDRPADLSQQFDPVDCSYETGVASCDSVFMDSPDTESTPVELYKKASRGAQRQLSFGLLYRHSEEENDLSSATERSNSVQSTDSAWTYKRTDSYTEAVCPEVDDLSSSSAEDNENAYSKEQLKSPSKLKRGSHVSGEKPIVAVMKAKSQDDDSGFDAVDGFPFGADVTLTNDEPAVDELSEFTDIPNVTLTKATPDRELITPNQGQTVSDQEKNMSSNLKEIVSEPEDNISTDRNAVDECDGVVASAYQHTLFSSPPLHRDTSTGFVVSDNVEQETLYTTESLTPCTTESLTFYTAESLNEATADFFNSDSESDYKTESVTLSPVSSSAEDEESADSEESEPFKQYHRRQHNFKRSRTDPARGQRSRPVTNSPRYHSDPTGHNRTPIMSPLPRSPPMSSSSPYVGEITPKKVKSSPPTPSPPPTPKNIDSKVAADFVRSASNKRSPHGILSPGGRGGSATSATRQHVSSPIQSPLPAQTSDRTANAAPPAVKVTGNSVSRMIASSTSGSSDDHKTSDSLNADDVGDSIHASPSSEMVSFQSEVALFSPRESSSNGSDECHCKDEVELEEAIALAKAMDISMDQQELPRVPGLSNTEREETITIHVQHGDIDKTDGNGNKVEYLEGVHWKRGNMIGTGAFSTCYQARDVRTGIIMAVKQVSFCRNSSNEQEAICESVREEIIMMAQLDHPNIVRIFGATQTGYHFNMFVEWMPGGSISHLLELYGAFSEPVITSYTQQVLMGMAYLHDNHILHRDMKGANLLVDSTGKRLRIGDFGACARLASQMTGAGEFRGQLLGTIAFMAPEVLRGEHYGRACDVWSVGCVIIEMFTEKPPWNASNVSNHLKLIFTIASANSSPPIPLNMPQALKDLMLRCLEAESKDRPSAKELLQHPLFTRYSKSRR